MNTVYLKGSMVAVFALSGAMALSPASQALAGETNVTLGNGDTATVQGGGTKVQTDAGGNVKIYVNGGGSVTVYMDDSIIVRPAVNGASTAAPKAGNRLADGTIYAGNGFAAAPADALGRYTWHDGNQYCEDLVAYGQDDWKLPTKEQLNRLYQNKNMGAFAGTFNDSAAGTTWAHYYWSSEERASHTFFAWNQSFADGYFDWNRKDGHDLSVRCVRAELRL
jgi:hypothetical protein